MLHLTRNATSDVEFGTNCNAGLTNLTLVLGESSVNGCTRCANFAAEEVCEFVENLEILLAAHAVAASNDYRCGFEVDFGFFDFTADDFHHEVNVGERLLEVKRLDFALVVGVVNLFLHHAFAYCCHLRTCVEIYDSGDDVAAKCRTNLQQEVLVRGLGGNKFAGFGRLGNFFLQVIADLEARAVGCKTAFQCRSHAGSQIPAHRRRAKEDDLRLLLTDDVANNLLMRNCLIRSEFGIVANVDYVNAILENLLANVGDVLVDCNGLQLASEFIGKFSTLGEEFEAHVSNNAVLNLAIYE